MNDRYDAGYGTDGAAPYELVGYDEYGRPVYQQATDQQTQQAQQAQHYEGYQQQGQQGYGYDPYGTGGQQQPSYDPYGTGSGTGTGGVPPQQPQAPSYDPYDPYGVPQQAQQAQQAGGPTAPYDPYGQAAPQAGPGQQPRAAEQTAHIPQQAGPVDDDEPAPAEPDREYRTEQFAFVEEPDGDSEDVIDWLAFTENRTERREEARRRARSRIVALVVVLALVAVGGVGYLWYAGKLPGLSASDPDTGTTTAAGAQKRDVIVVHLHDTTNGGTATALLVDNTTTKQGTTVLLPNSLALTGDDGTTTTLAKSVEDDGSEGTRTAIDTVLGTDIEGTWRLDTPFLLTLVDLVGNIEIDADADVPDPDAKKGEAPLVRKGEGRTLSGKAAVAYATHRADGEDPNAQLERFGQVLHGVLRKMTSDPGAATTTIQTLGQIIEPPLTDKDLGSFLARLSDLAKGGDHKTALLPVRDDGTLTAEASDSVVEDVLGGTAKSPDKDAAVSVSVRNATGVQDHTDKARVVLLNGGFTFRDAGTTGAPETASKVVYANAAEKENATEVAKTLGLPAGSVTQGKVSANARVSVVLGQDYDPGS
ncbi:LCP family protein [Streptomyces griseoloalbus]|uniref:Anionic cell wall polymer biosynthesis LytR-Cps2A-Psr (LCP) family protein n=1 Tax=Streptomyces griseoloalbus TaxID=67303 RepID=A0A7W8BKS6_9ACTN|nr:LytR C-terminal domain-containing protein [Streptomyces albaduncus]MBB5123718.1 anionic cell wall polymer biosynthesis LytR-Cps2A-Psr (LCP) family protein [Streptomyces albaduncus]GGW40877.1 membrane protein [Streptomyces albaduncus]